MLFYGLFLIFFGIVILLKPEFLAYIVAIFFILAWMNILTIYFLLKPKKEKDIIIGSYKIVKK